MVDEAVQGPLPVRGNVQKRQRKPGERRRSESTVALIIEAHSGTKTTLTGLLFIHLRTLPNVCCPDNGGTRVAS